MKRRGFGHFEIAILLLPVLLLIGVAVAASIWRPSHTGRVSVLDDLATFLLFREPRFYALAFFTLQAFSVVIIALVMFLQTMIDRVAPPFEMDGKKKP